MAYMNHSSHNMKPSSSSSSSPAYIISNWFSKLKLHKAAKPSPKTKQNDQHGRFYTMDADDAYWRLSFGADKSTRSTGGINPLWYDYSDEFHAPSVCPGNEKYQNFNEMVSDIKKMRENRGKQNLDYQQSSRKSIIREKQLHHGRERDVFSVGPLQIKRDPCNARKQPKIQNFNLRPVKEDYAFEAVKGDGSIPVSGDTKLKKIKVKTERYGNIMNRESQVRSRVRAYSPRTECKIRALEDMKKARMKSKKMMKERKEQSCSVLDSFAVVKNSFNPEKDFRDSMVEMVREKGIARPQQLEQLLACYLTLNSDEYHDLIVKVFRQMWSDLNSQIE